MAYIWTPDAGVLVSYRDDGNGFSASVTVEGETTESVDPVTGEPVTEQAPSPNQFEVSGLDSTVDFSYSGNTWTISASKEAAAGIFPVQITYLQTKYKDSMQVVSNWAALPEDAEEVVKLETTASSPYSSSFDVTASVDGDNPETKTYSLEIVHTYTANADRLKLEVDKRS